MHFRLSATLHRRVFLTRVRDICLSKTYFLGVNISETCFGYTCLWSHITDAARFLFRITRSGCLLFVFYIVEASLTREDRIQVEVVNCNPTSNWRKKNQRFRWFIQIEGSYMHMLWWRVPSTPHTPNKGKANQIQKRVVIDPWLLQPDSRPKMARASCI
jgi:hypothetical protein